MITYPHDLNQYRIKIKHPALDNVAKIIAQITCKAINKAATEIEDNNMPYKAQYILEEVIKILKEQV